MADLIDRDELIDVLDELENEYRMKDDFDSAFAVEFATSKVRQQPPADTERHAHWIKEKVEDITYPWYRRVCSNCKMQSPLGREHNYCPHCGCKMDEDRNESRNT